MGQMDLMRNSKLNEAGKQIVSIRFGGFTGPTPNDKYLLFKNTVLADPEIEHMTLANHLPRLDFFGPINMEMRFPDINEDKHEWFQLNGDYDFPRTFGLKIIAGRDFDPPTSRTRRPFSSTWLRYLRCISHRLKLLGRLSFALTT